MVDMINTRINTKTLRSASIFKQKGNITIRFWA